MRKPGHIRFLFLLFLSAGILNGCSRADTPFAATKTTEPPALPTIGISPTSDKFTMPLQPTQTDTPSTGLATPQGAPEPSPSLYPLPGIELNQTMDPAKLDLVVQAGAYWIRRNKLKWSLVEPAEGERNWDALAGLERELLEAAKRGLKVVLVVGDTPVWAQKTPGHTCGAVLQSKLPALASFMREAVARYSAVPYNVKYWEIGNEPDIDYKLVPPESEYGCWGDDSDAYYGGGYYAEMLRQVYPVVKAVDPQVQLLVGGLLLDCDPVNPPEDRDCTPSLFLEGILRSGGGEYFDGISYHAYDYYLGRWKYGNANWNSNGESTGPVAIVKARYLRSVLAAYRQAGKYLMNTEAGLICGRVGDEPECQSGDFELTKAAYVAQVNTAALAEALRANIWYSLTGWRGSGLVDGTLQPNQAFQAFQVSAKQLEQAAFVRSVTEITGVRGYEFYRGGERLQVLWSSDGSKHAVHFEQMPEAILDLLGENIQPAQDLTISHRPIYVIWGR